jgi:hypothetical protein
MKKQKSYNYLFVFYSDGEQKYINHYLHDSKVRVNSSLVNYTQNLVQQGFTDPVSIVNIIELYE